MVLLMRTLVTEPYAGVNTDVCKTDAVRSLGNLDHLGCCSLDPETPVEGCGHEAGMKRTNGTGEGWVSIKSLLAIYTPQASTYS